VLSPSDIRALALRKYPDFLRSVVDGTPFFPLAIRFGKPSTADGFAKLKAEISALANSELGYRIEWREVRSRRIGVGTQKLPEKVCFETEEEYTSAIGKTKEVARFRVQVVEAATRCPETLVWVRQRPLAAIEFQKVWGDLLLVCAYLKANGPPGCYARELPLPIGTKFISDHQGVLREMLGHVLPPEAIRADAADFETRFGFKKDPGLVRSRILDSAVVPPGWPSAVTDFSVPPQEFATLHWPAPRVLIVENKFTFLTLPPMSRTLAVWGAGAAAELLSGARWLVQREIWYWGDLDVAGFHILNRLRATFPNIQSVMMDEATLRQYESLAVSCMPPRTVDLSSLTSAEQAVCRELEQRQLRLEQEKLPHPHAVEQLIAASTDGLTML
jgi:hypothetical protein